VRFALKVPDSCRQPGGNVLRERTMNNAIALPAGGLDQLMEAAAAAQRKLDGILNVESPTKPMALVSDCCSSNNYDER
jgi:hypothetical protein